MKSKSASLYLLLAFTLSAHAEEIKIWSDAHGLLDSAFCERNETAVYPDANISSFLGVPLADGTGANLMEENGEPVSVSCLEANGSTNYFLIRFSKENLNRVVAVRAQDTSIFQNTESLWNEEMPYTARISAAIPEGIEVQEGALDLVVCTNSSYLNVRDESLEKILFQARRFESAKVVQSFGKDRFKKVIDGVEHAFVKAEFASAKVGWVAESFLVNRSQCAGATNDKPSTSPQAQTWTFPTLLRPSVSYKDGMRRFKAGRSGGRLHAACDLYRVKDEKAMSVSSGKVIRAKYYFYEGTYAIEIKHTGGKVARYGEITGKDAGGVSLNANVSTGQVLGYIGKVNSGCCTPMLHFELYSGTASGSLSQKGNAFQRRKDLIDPTSLLSEWERIKFGKSY